MSFLIHNGAELNSTDSMGHTALHIAAIRSLVESIVILIRYGCDEGKKDYMGKTALDYAIDSQGADSVTLLRLARLSKSEKIEDFNTTLMEALNEIQINFDNRPISTSKSITDVGTYTDVTLPETDLIKPKLRKLPRNKLNPDSILFKYADLLTRMSSELSHEELYNFEEIVRSKIIDQTIEESGTEETQLPVLPIPNTPDPDLKSSGSTPTTPENDYLSFSLIENSQRTLPERQVTQSEKKTKRDKSNLYINANTILRHATSYRYLAKNSPIINGSSRKEKEKNFVRANSEKY